MMLLQMLLNKNVHAIPLHRKCVRKIKHLKSTFGSLSDSVLNQDDDNDVVSRLLEIHDDEHDNESTLTLAAEDDDDNILTLAEEDEVYKPYGFWVPKPPVLSVQSNTESLRTPLRGSVGILRQSIRDL